MVSKPSEMLPLIGWGATDGARRARTWPMRACFRLPDVHGGLTPSLSALCRSKTRCDRTFPGKPARPGPYRVSSVQKDVQRLQRGPLRRAMDTRVFERVLQGGVDLTFSLFRVAKVMRSDCQGLCLFHYILACEALFSATDGAMRACLWPMRPLVPRQGEVAGPP